MSNVHIKRAVENIRSGTTIYTPVIELIVNAIQAIEVNPEPCAREVVVAVRRAKQLQIDTDDGAIPPVESFVVSDDGIGFDDSNREAFDTLYTDNKISQGGKGFGRFTCLKYFEDVLIDSTFSDAGTLRRRQFEMGKENEIIVKEKISAAMHAQTGSVVTLESAKKSGLDKKLSTIARALVEKLLPYFIHDDYKCPKVILMEEDGSEEIVLNDYLKSSFAVIREIRTPTPLFSLEANGETRNFKVRLFKFFSPGSSKSKISLVAHNREVTEVATHSYVPEFVDDFIEVVPGAESGVTKNYVIKTYVFGDYLDQHVSLERGGFEFHKDTEVLHGISQNQIESQAAELTKAAVEKEVTSRQQKKARQVREYVEESAPWHRTILKKVDLSSFPYNPSSQEIEARLQDAKFRDEAKIRQDVKRMLNEASAGAFESDISEIVERISETSKNDLVHYVALRKNVLALFEKSLEFSSTDGYRSEGFVHDIIFPRGKDSESIGYEEHNLWLIDERLNFARYLASDIPLDGGTTERPDIVSFDRPFAFRGDNQPSNPVSIFEFKKPQRDNFVNPSSKEDPIEQIVRYVNSIQDGKFKTPQGRNIQVGETTPFYGYVVCDITPKVKKWLEREKDFKVMPDALGWFNWYGNINLYIEVLSWDKVLKDASMRNSIFFQKLGIS